MRLKERNNSVTGPTPVPIIGCDVVPDFQQDRVCLIAIPKINLWDYIIKLVQRYPSRYPYWKVQCDEFFNNL